jgi:hypothetical protein
LIFLSTVANRVRWVAGSAGALSRRTRSSDGVGEFGEGRGDPQEWGGADAELVVAAAKILQKGVPCDDPCAVRSVLMPRIGLSRRLSCP